MIAGRHFDSRPAYRLLRYTRFSDRKNDISYQYVAKRVVCLELSRARPVYTGRLSATRHVYTAVFTARTCVYVGLYAGVHRLCTGRGHVYTTVYGPCTRWCTRPVAVYGPCRRPCTGRVHGRVHMYKPRTWLWIRQRVLNAAALVVTGTRKFDRGLSQILHDELHWLDVPDRVFFKLAVIVHRCLNGRAPLYMSTCRTTGSTPRPPALTLGDSCVPATVNFLKYHVTDSILMVAWLFQRPAPQS